LSLGHALEKIPEAFLGETNGYIIFVFEYRPFDERWIVDHCRKGFVAIHVGAVHFRNFSPGQALLVQQRFPADAIRPAFQHLDVDAIVTDVMKRVFDFLVREILACLPARIAAFYSVNR